MRMIGQKGTRGWAPLLAFTSAAILGIPTFLSCSSAAASTAASSEAFRPGETLTYDVSWSKAVKAGSAVMEVREAQLPSGRAVFRFIVNSRTEGAVAKVYSLGDRVQSVFDPRSLQSLSYTLEAKHGRRSRRLALTFDHARRTVSRSLNNEPPQVLEISDGAQDPLSALYVLRMEDEFSAGKPTRIEVFDGSRNRSIEAQTAGRERVKTPAGEFDTIKITASGGIFPGDGEVAFWLTDDDRKVPVLIKSRLAIGSVVFTLRELRTGASNRQRRRTNESTIESERE